MHVGSACWENTILLSSTCHSLKLFVHPDLWSKSRIIYNLLVIHNLVRKNLQMLSIFTVVLDLAGIFFDTRAVLVHARCHAISAQVDLSF